MGWIDTTTANPTEKLVAEHGTEQRQSITICSGVGTLSKGQTMGQYNTGICSGSYDAYDNSVSNGLQVAKGILTDKVDATSSGVNTTVYTHGKLYKQSLIGYDATADSDLKNIETVDWVKDTHDA